MLRLSKRGSRFTVAGLHSSLKKAWGVSCLPLLLALFCTTNGKLRKKQKKYTSVVLDVLPWLYLYRFLLFWLRRLLWELRIGPSSALRLRRRLKEARPLAEQKRPLVSTAFPLSYDWTRRWYTWAYSSIPWKTNLYPIWLYQWILCTRKCTDTEKTRL